MNQSIYNAIKEMKILTFIYDDQPRVVEPHTYGLTKKGNEAIRCYQIKGGSNSGTVPGWHLMKVDKMISLKITNELFAKARDGYKRGDKGLPTIFCEL